MNTYPFLLILHLFAAFVFVGTVTFEVLFLEPVQKRLPVEVRKALGGQLGPRVRAVVPWAVLVLYLAGLGMAWQYRAALASPSGSPLGLLLSIKIALASSVLAHVVTAATLARRQRPARRAAQAGAHQRVLSHGRDRDPGQDHVLSVLVDRPARRRLFPSSPFLVFREALPYVPVLRQLASSLAFGALGLSSAHAQPTVQAPASQAVPSLAPVVVSGESLTRALDPGPASARQNCRPCPAAPT